jgi:uncharacterized integral membrane protein
MTHNDQAPPLEGRRKRGDRRGLGWHAIRVGLWLLVLPLVFAVIAVVMMFDATSPRPAG